MLHFNSTGMVTDARPTGAPPRPSGNPHPNRYIPPSPSYGYTRAQVQPSQWQISHTQTPADQMTTAHLDKVAAIFQELLISDTYLLAVQLGLPGSYRLKLLNDGAAGNKVQDSLLSDGAVIGKVQNSLFQQLQAMAANSKLSHSHLLIALARCGRLDLFNKYTTQLRILCKIDDYRDNFENALVCEHPHYRSRGYDQRLCLIDLCLIFAGKLADTSATPVETLAQAIENCNLLTDTELSRLIKFDIENAGKEWTVPQPPPENGDNENGDNENGGDENGDKVNDKLATYWLLERIYQNRDGITAREVASILCKPEIGEITIARRLLRLHKTDHQPDKNLHIWRKAKLLDDVPAIFQLISGLSDHKVTLNPEEFAKALGVPAYKIAFLQPLKLDTSTLTNIILQARKVHDYLYPEYVLYAVQQAVESFETRHLNQTLAKLDEKLNTQYFRRLVPIKPPSQPWPFRIDKKLGQMPDSVPLTMTFLGSLPLSHNWIPIGLAMGVSREELQQIACKSASDKRLAAFYLSKKLIETNRQLETHDLYQALLDLNDQQAIGYFDKSLMGLRSEAMPEAMKQVLKHGQTIAHALCRAQTEDPNIFAKYLKGTEEEREWIPGVDY